MNEITFTIPGEPQGKGRPKFSTYGGHITARTPGKTASYENLIRYCFEKERGNFKPIETAPVAVEIIACYKIPKNISQKKKMMMLDGDIYPTKKPDVDNIVKVVCDALNGFAYRDDSQVVMLAMNKAYSEEPHVWVNICEVEV